MNTMISQEAVVNGKTVEYEQFNGTRKHAKVVGAGRKNGERIFYLDDGHWCYLSDICRII